MKSDSNTALNVMLYCFPCRMFRQDDSQSAFTSDGFSSWNKATERFRAHVGGIGSVHNKCLQSWKDYKLAQRSGNSDKI